MAGKAVKVTETDPKTLIETVSEIINEGNKVIFFTKDHRRTISTGVGKIEFAEGKFETDSIQLAKAVIENKYFGREIFLGK